MQSDERSGSGPALSFEVGQSSRELFDDNYRRQRQAALAANFRERVAFYLRGRHEGVELRSHQPAVFTDLDAFFGDTAEEAGRKILMPLPPNAGKSTMSVLIAAMSGIGERPAEDLPPFKAMALVPRRVALQHLIDKCQEFAPHIKVKPYKRSLGSDQFNHADLVVMTYKAAVSAPEEVWQSLAASTDLLTLDEVHRALGPETASRLHGFIKTGQPTVIAMSATPEFNHTHSAWNVFGIERSVRPVSAREAIELGMSNGAQLFAVFSGEDVYLASKRGSVTEADVQKLADLPGRNKLITDIMRDMALAGQRGLIQCIPGGKNDHAYKIAALASDQKIVDPVTGRRRFMRVAAVGNEINTNKENDNIIRAFRRGEYDALTFTKYLTEAFDYPLDYLVAGAPTASKVDMGQFVGRGARFNARGLTAMFVIIDRYSSRTPKQLCTPFDILGEECFGQGIVIRGSRRSEGQKRGEQAKEKGKKSPAQEDLFRPFSVDDFSPTVREAMGRIPSGTVIDELLLVRAEYPSPPAGYIPLIELPAVKEGIITAEGARYALSRCMAEDGRPVFISVRTGAISQYVLPEVAQRIIAERCADSSNLISRLEIDNFFLSQGWPRPSFDIFLGGCKATEATHIISKGTIYMEPSEARKLLYHIVKVPLVNPSVEISLADLASALGHATSSQLQSFIKRNPEAYEPYLRRRRRGINPGAYRFVDAITIEGANYLINKARASSQQLAKRIGSRSVAQVVAETQARAKMEFRKRNLCAAISTAAIQAFLKQNAPVEESLALPPQPLDEGHQLSGHGQNWEEYAACQDLPSNLFHVTTAKGIRIAKAICDGCEVKGDCLLATLRQPSENIAGGFTADERRKIGREAVAWIEGSKDH